MTTDEQQRRELERLMAPLTSATLAREHTKAAGVEYKLLDVEPESRVTGEFTAKISDWDRDRTNERFARHAFDNALGDSFQRFISDVFQARATALPAVCGGRSCGGRRSPTPC